MIWWSLLLFLLGGAAFLPFPWVELFFPLPGRVVPLGEQKGSTTKRRRRPNSPTREGEEERRSESSPTQREEQGPPLNRTELYFSQRNPTSRKLQACVFCCLKAASSVFVFQVAIEVSGKVDCRRLRRGLWIAMAPRGQAHCCSKTCTQRKLPCIDAKAQRARQRRKVGVIWIWCQLSSTQKVGLGSIRDLCAKC